MITLNGERINPTTFPDKTSQVWQISESLFDLRGRIATVEWKFDSEAEFIHLAQLKMLLDSREKLTHLLITYLPYGRQDKHIANDATFGLHTFALLLNTLKFETVSIIDAHSNTATDLIDNSFVYYTESTIQHLINYLGVNLICYPDKGATTKYSNVYDFYPRLNVVTGQKLRAQDTGNIMLYSINDPQNFLKDADVLIIDDICDGGATFIALATELKNLGANEIFLYVTHGLFTKGLKKMREAGILRFFCKDGEAVPLGDGNGIKSYDAVFREEESE